MAGPCWPGDGAGTAGGRRPRRGAHWPPGGALPGPALARPAPPAPPGALFPDRHRRTPTCLILPRAQRSVCPRGPPLNSARAARACGRQASLPEPRRPGPAERAEPRTMGPAVAAALNAGLGLCSPLMSARIRGPRPGERGPRTPLRSGPAAPRLRGTPGYPLTAPSPGATAGSARGPLCTDFWSVQGVGGGRGGLGLTGEAEAPRCICCHCGACSSQDHPERGFTLLHQ